MLIDNPRGSYRFLKGIGPYSSGVVAMPGFEIVHIRLLHPLALDLAFERMKQHLKQEGRDITALCGMQLRIPAPLSFEGFYQFNQDYQKKLRELGLFMDDINPLARTNIAVSTLNLEGPVLHAFSYTVPSNATTSTTFIVAGAGDLKDQSDLTPAAIVRPDDTSEDGLREKVTLVMQVMQERLYGLQADWPMVSCVDVYTIYPLRPMVLDTILGPIGEAAWHGIHWCFGEPPIAGLAFEMDLRGVRQERWISWP